MATTEGDGPPLLGHRELRLFTPEGGKRLKCHGLLQAQAHV